MARPTGLFQARVDYSPLVPRLPSRPTSPTRGTPIDTEEFLQEEHRLIENIAALQRREREVVLGLQDLEEVFNTRARPLRYELDMVRKKALHEAAELERLYHTLSSDTPIPPGPRALRWVDSDVFSLICMTIIICNVMVMILEQTAVSDAQRYWVLDQLFLSWYVAELVLKLVLHQKGFLIGACNADRVFAWLDLFIMVTSVLDQWLMPLVETSGLMRHRGNLFTINTTALRALRVIRVTRMLRLLKAVNLLWNMDLTWADGHRFEFCIMVVILINAVTMGLELDFNWEGFRWLNNIMLSIYIFEIIVRIKLHRWEFFTQNAFWNNLDFVIVLGGVIDQVGVPAYVGVHQALTGVSKGDADNQGGFLSVLRILRLMRIARLYRLLTAFRALRQLVSGIADAMQGTIWVILLTFIILYIFAILFTTLVGKGLVFGSGNAPPDAVQNFGTVEMSMYSLFKLMNDDQSVVGFTGSVWVRLMFMFTMVLLNWVMLATLTSVVTDHMNSSTMRSEKHEEKMMLEIKKQRCNARLRCLFKEMDVDRSGFVTREEFEDLLKNPALREEFMDASGLKPQDIVELFDYLSHELDNGQRAILYEDFIERMQKEGKAASERSIFRLEEEIRASERRNERRFQNVLRLLKASPELRADLTPNMGVPIPLPDLKQFMRSKMFEDATYLNAL